jgi:hypothetical protein
MSDIIIIVISTAVTTSVLFLGILYLAYIWKIKPEFELKIAKAAQEIEDRVKEGVLSAGTELLPEFGEEVTKGFTRALPQWPATEMSKVAKTGVNLFEESLSTFMGTKKK